MVEETNGDIPFYLMPLAAAMGIFVILGGFQIFYVLYANLTHKEGSSTPPSVPLKSRKMAFLAATILTSIFGYAKIVAYVDYAITQSEYVHFDPFDILGVEISSNVAEIKQAYRTLSLQYHPDKGGDAKIFLSISTAYRALTTDKDKYERYGHPDGPLTNKQLSFALPGWLFHPKGTVSIILLLLYLGFFVGIIYVIITWETKQTKMSNKEVYDTSVAAADTAYLAATLSPESTHEDILFCIATAPENIQTTEEALENIEDLKRKKEAKINQDVKKPTTNAFDLDGDGWDDEEDDDATKKAKQEEASKLRVQKQLAEAQGDGNILMEGLDDGVLGQKWVENTLESMGQWPPRDLSFLSKITFRYKGKVVSALEHPAIRRNLCFTMGRLNSVALNTHGDLLDAHSKNKLDQTYFKGSMVYRQRAGLLLEAALRLAATLKSYRLAKTIIEAVSMFKIGVVDPSSPKNISWFKGLMQKQYTEEGVPKLQVSDLNIETPGQDEIATGDLCAITMTIDRMHAEAFTKVNVASCQRQGIPTQVALQTYREGWWVLVRAKKMDGGETPKVGNFDDVLSNIIKGFNTQKFDREKDENSLLVAWPMIVRNMAQKSGNVKVQFKAPSVPGKYTIFMAIKSQEFLGTDQDFQLSATVIDSTLVERKHEEKDESVEDEKEEETKKEK